MKYCRYCAFCISGDCYYCTFYNKVLNTVDRVTSCPEFVKSVMGDVDTGKPYKPKEPKTIENSSFEQIRIDESEVEE